MSKYDSWKLASPDDERAPRGEPADGRLEDARDRIAQLEAALTEIIELADTQADVDGGTPNLAMRILVAAEKAL